MIDERLERSRLTLTTFDDAEADDIDYWKSKTPTERIEALEYLRRWLYGNDQVDLPILRVVTQGNLSDVDPVE